MTIFTALTDLLIKPLELFFELFFTACFYVVQNHGLTIFFLSLAVNLLVMPLYQKADAMQEEARLTDQKLSPMVSHIKKHFKGDERFMILQTYYRQNHYKPTDVLKGSVSLLLEVPFFMAAYRFLSNLDILQSVSFGPIADLGAPDQLLVLGGFALNLLPILMTVINLVSSYIYTKGFPMKTKLQLYLMAALFLVLLYDSPSGLVFYWTLNNLFSLVKNIVSKLVKPEKVMGVLCSLTGIPVLMLIPGRLGSPRICTALLAAALILQLPLLMQLLKGHVRTASGEISVSDADRNLFLLSCAGIAVLTGLLIPSAVVANSPAEFVNPILLSNSLWYVISVLLTAMGAFLIWPSIFYMLVSPGAKKAMGLGSWLLLGMGIIDYMFFGKNYGNLMPNLNFDISPVPAGSEILLNLAVILAAAALMALIWFRKKQIVRMASLVTVLALVCMGIINLPGIYSKASSEITTLESFRQQTPSIPLSKQGKNVMVLMMDRAVGAYLPYFFQEKPELMDQFSGFTFYPNTISHGKNTNIGAPGLLGGYEYTPERMNRRNQDTLQEKHDEASMVLPVLFDHEDYQVTLLDSPNLGYSVVPAQSVFQDYPDITVTSLMKFYEGSDQAQAKASQAVTRRNLFSYSLFKIAPTGLQPVLYSSGSYNDPDLRFQSQSADINNYHGQISQGLSRATGFNPILMSSFRALQALPGITEVQDNDQNHYLFMANNVPHETMLMQAPEYVPSYKMDNTQYDAEHADRFTWNGHTMDVHNIYQMGSYHSNMAYLVQLGQWFDYLRSCGVYDNTRIIIASDHGRTILHYPELVIGKNSDLDILNYNCLLMVKDFGSEGPVVTDPTFMTNADVPTLAIQNLLKADRNPFTGAALDGSLKEDTQIVLDSMEHCGENNTPAYLPGDWYSVSENLFDTENWSYLSGPGILPEN